MEEDAEYCGNTCKHGANEEEHICPFQEDVNNDSNFKCTCCEECTYQCAQDI